MLHSETSEPANQILQCGDQAEHLLFGLALKDGRSQLKLAHRQDVGLLTHLHCSLGQEDLELRREKELVRSKRRIQKLSPPTGRARLWRRQPGNLRLQQPLLLLQPHSNLCLLSPSSSSFFPALGHTTETPRAGINFLCMKGVRVEWESCLRKSRKNKSSSHIPNM